MPRDPDLTDELRQDLVRKLGIVMDDNDWIQQDLATALGVSQGRISTIMDGGPAGCRLAILAGRLFKFYIEGDGIVIGAKDLIPQSVRNPFKYIDMLEVDIQQGVGTGRIRIEPPDELDAWTRQS